VDNSDSGALIVGDWTNSVSSAGFWGANYIHDGDTAKGTKSVTFRPNLPTAGIYEVYLRWTTNPNRATNVPVDIVYPAGTKTVSINQTVSNATWVLLTATNFNAGTNGYVRIRTDNTSGFVIADAARWVSTTETNLASVQLIATDPVAGETGKKARVTFIRPSFAVDDAIEAHYQLSGTASNGFDIVALPGTVNLPVGVASTNVIITAANDIIPEGDKILNIALLPGTNYSVGALSNATIHILDTPFDGWRFVHFNSTEIQNPGISGIDADPDQDGASNLSEFQSGTDPRDAQSVLRVKIDAQTNTASIHFLAGANHSFTLQYGDDIAAGAWTDLTNFPSAETNRTLAFRDELPQGITNRFYKVRSP
jgi:hypothetical protein